MLLPTSTILVHNTARLYGYGPGFELEAEIPHRSQLLRHTDKEKANGITVQEGGLTHFDLISRFTAWVGVCLEGVLKLFPSQ